MGKGYTRKNNKTIRTAFERLAKSKHERMIEGLRGILDDAVLFIFEQHLIDGHENHRKTGDSYGWAIGYNGQIVDIKITNEGEEIGMSVQEELNVMIEDTTGYTGIIMAGMVPERWFVWEYEEEYQDMAKDMIAAEFFRFFQE